MRARITTFNTSACWTTARSRLARLGSSPHQERQTHHHDRKQPEHTSRHHGGSSSFGSAFSKIISQGTELLPTSIGSREWILRIDKNPPRPAAPRHRAQPARPRADVARSRGHPDRGDRPMDEGEAVHIIHVSQPNTQEVAQARSKRTSGLGDGLAAALSRQ